MNSVLIKKVLRQLFPIPKPQVIEDFDDICDVQLVPYEQLKKMYLRELSKHSELNTKIVHFEFGIFNGTSLSAAVNAYEELGYDEVKIFAFDAYLGLPEDIIYDDNGVWEPSLYKCDKAKMLDCLERRGIDITKVSFIDGWYEDTLSQENMKRLNIKEFDVAFIDCDTYSSSILCLMFLKSLLKEGSIIIFDDWRLHDLDIYNLGEKKAFIEFTKKLSGWTWRRFRTYNRKSQGFKFKESG